MAINASNIPVPIPSHINEITPDWVEKVTGDCVAPEDFHLEGDIQEGIGFLSSICRVSYKTKSGDKNSIIVKLLPTNSKWVDFALSDLADEREIQFYSIVLPDLLSVIPELQENVCKYYNGYVIPEDPGKGTKRASMLIMDDLKAHGFEMMSFSGSNSDKVVHGLVTFMARFHFGAMAVEVNKRISLPELYPIMQAITDSELLSSQMETMSEDSYQHLENLLTTHNISQDVWDRYKKLKPYTRILVKKVEDMGRLNPCMIHTDVWPPNIQIHDSLPVKVLDWQLLGYRDVAYDLSVMLYTVLSKEKLNNENLRRLIKRYHDEFEQLCKDKGYEGRIKRRSWEEFEEFFFTWGAAFGYIIFLPGIECYVKDHEKYANVFRVLCEESNIPEFLLRVCLNDCQ